jgi:hypothetical protein
MLGDDGFECLAGGFQDAILGASPGYTQTGVGNDADYLCWPQGNRGFAAKTAFLSACGG